MGLCIMCVMLIKGCHILYGVIHVQNAKMFAPSYTSCRYTFPKYDR